MKYLRTISTPTGDDYKIYLSTPNDRCERFYIKWRKWIFGVIPFFTFIKTEYISMDNERISFSNIGDTLSYINKLDVIVSACDSYQSVINQVS